MRIKSDRIEIMKRFAVSFVLLVVLAFPFLVPAQEPLTKEEKAAYAEKLAREVAPFILKKASGSNEMVVEKLLIVIRLYREIDNKLGEANSLYIVGMIYSELGNHKKALDYLKQSLPIKRALADKMGEAIILTAIADAYQKLDDKRSALDCYNRALLIFRAIDDKDKVAASLNNIGLIYANLGENEKALKNYSESLLLKKAAGNRGGEADTLNNMGIVYSALGEKTKALENYKQALLLYQEFDDTDGKADVLHNTGMVYSDLGEKNKAMEYFNQTLMLRKEIGDKLGEAMVLANIGMVSSDLGEKAKALDLYNLAVSIFRAAGDRKGESAVLNSIGMVRYDLREYAKALTFLDQALRLEKARSDHVGEANTLTNIGRVYSAQGDKKTALKYYTQTLATYREIGDRGGEAKLLNNIGSIYFSLEDYSSALDYYDQSRRIKTAVGDRAGEAVTLDNIGEVYRILGKNGKALEYCNLALRLSRATDAKTTQAHVLTDFMVLWNEQNNQRLAIFYGKQSVNLYQELRTKIKDLDKDTQATYRKSIEEPYRYLADLLIAEGRFTEAQQVLALLKEEEYVDYVRRDANEIKDLKARVSLKPEEQQLIERYNLIADKVTAIGTEFQNLDDKRRRLPEGSRLPPSEQDRYDKLSAQLTDANAAFKLFLEKVLVEELPLRTGKKEIELDRALQEELKGWGEGTAALSTVAGEDRYRVILTTPNAQVDGKTEIKSADLNKKIFAFRDALQNPGVDARPLGKELYDILIGPIAKDLQAANARTLLWSLDGTLRYLPLAALSPDGQTYLVEKYQNVLITSATRQKLTAGNESDWRALGLGVSDAQIVADPVLPDEKIPFGKLPGVKTELMSIVREVAGDPGLLEGKRLMDSQFTVQTLGESLSREMPDGRRRYTVVHVASHFYLGSSSANSFLLLGGGTTLTLEQISNSPQMKFGVELVTLSACNTAFGNSDSTGKEIDSLATFIELRGAKAIMATLWPVVDESTQLVMSEFYRLHKENPNISKAEAIQQAQLAMLRGRLKSSGQSSGCRSKVTDMSGQKQPDFKCDSKAPFAHPYFWSPFVLIGNWR